LITLTIVQLIRTIVSGSIINIKIHVVVQSRFSFQNQNQYFKSSVKTLPVWIE
jgi:hypothetical protein